MVLIGLLLALPAVAADSIFPYKAHTETLPNGFRVILIPMSSGGLVDYWSIVRTGSRDEFEPGHTGFAHFFEHMMFRGTENYPAEVYNDMLLSLGANFNAFTGEDLTGYIQGIVAEDLETVMTLESDRFQNLSYSQDVFQTEAGAVYGEYRKNRMSPFFTISEAISQTAFDEHTYGHTVMGYEEDIRAMPTMYEYSKSFFSRYYRPENVVLLIVGDLEVEPTMELVRKYYGAWKPGYEPPKVTPEPPQTEERRIEVSYEYRSLPLLGVAYKSKAFDPNDRTLAAAELFCELAFGETSELYKKLVLDEQVVERITIDSGIMRDPGLISLLSRIKDPSKIDYVLAEIDRVIAQGQTTPPDAHRLAAVQSRLKYEFLMDLDTPSAVALSITRIVAVTGGIEAVDELYRSYERVTPEDVVAAARELFVPAHRTVAILRGGS
ncbi:MAG: insulinase family protein [bacterium]|nr:insulinase family protein [bacterium]